MFQWAVSVFGSTLIVGVFGAPDIAQSSPAFTDADWVGLGSGMGGGGSPFVLSMVCDDLGDLFVGGSFSTAGAKNASVFAGWDGTDWYALTPPTDGGVLALVFDRAGSLYVGGSFTTIGGINANRIARWDGNKWFAVGDGLNDEVHALTMDPSGNIYAGGYFTAADGVGASRVAKWDGNNWSPLGSGLGSLVSALASDTNGNIYAGGSFTGYVAKWDGSGWRGIGSLDGPVRALALDTSGGVYAGGTFVTADSLTVNGVAKFNGRAWSVLGSGLGSPAAVYALASDSFGHLYAGGSFTTADGQPASRIAKWDGNHWSALASGTDKAVFSLACDRFGNIFAGGAFQKTGTNSTPLIAEALLGRPNCSLSIVANGDGTNTISAINQSKSPLALGWTYALEFTTNVAGPAIWVPQLTNSLPTTGSLSLTNVNGAQGGYYRLRFFD